MVSIDDPSVLAKIISLALDQSIRDYANLSRVSHLFLCLSKQYLEHEIKNPPKKTTGKEYTVIIGVGQITFTTKDTFVIYIADPHDKKQTLFNWSIKGRFESRNSKHSETIENICRTALYPWELVKFYDSLRNKISNSIAQYWKDIEAEKEKIFGQPTYSAINLHRPKQSRGLLRNLNIGGWTTISDFDTPIQTGTMLMFFQTRIFVSLHFCQKGFN